MASVPGETLHQGATSEKASESNMSRKKQDACETLKKSLTLLRMREPGKDPGDHAAPMTSGLLGDG